MVIFYLDVKGGIYSTVALTAYEVVSEGQNSFKVKKIQDLIGSTYRDTIRKNADTWFATLDVAAEEARKAQEDIVAKDKRAWESEIARLEKFNDLISKLKAERQNREA